MRASRTFLFASSCVVLIAAFGASNAQRSPSGDFVFPDLKELAIGDPCTIAPSNGFPFAQRGTCQRIRECSTFVRRVIREPFDIRRDVCYFEVHDPVVCCIPSNDAFSQVKDLSGEDNDANGDYGNQLY